jgi:hypothetical protein
MALDPLTFYVKTWILNKKTAAEVVTGSIEVRIPSW